MKRLVGILLGLSTLIYPSVVNGQFDYKRKIEGMSIRFGGSKGFGDSQVIQQSISPAFNVSLYHRHNLNTKNSSLIPFHYLITEFNFGSKQGTAVVNSLSEIARIENNYIEIALVAPFTWELSDKVALNAGFGGSILYVTDQRISPVFILSGSPKKYNTIKGTILADFHALILIGTSSNMLIGLRTILEPSKYGFIEIGGYVGFSLPSFDLKKKP